MILFENMNVSVLALSARIKTIKVLVVHIFLVEIGLGKVHHGPVAGGFEVHAAFFKTGKLRIVRQVGSKRDGVVRYHGGGTPQTVAGFRSLGAPQHE